MHSLTSPPLTETTEANTKMETFNEDDIFGLFFNSLSSLLAGLAFYVSSTRMVDEGVVYLNLFS
jgi:hypothetical protein